MKPFDVSPLGRVRFGRGALDVVDLGLVGERPLLIRGGPHLERSGAIERIEHAVGAELQAFAVRGEPTLATIDAALSAGRAIDCTGVIALGGGSVLDAGKATAALLTNGGNAIDYLEVIGAGRSIDEPSAPFVAIPTTAGTGAEVTRNAVLASPEHGIKASIRSPHLVPALAVVDPSLADDCPAVVTAPSGLDALTQVIEPFLSRNRNPFCDALCRDAIQRAGRSLRPCITSGEPDARDEMAYVALVSGVCLTNAGLGAVHGFAGPLGGMRPIGHGTICAALLPHVLQANFDAASADADHDLLGRFDEIGRLLTGVASAVAAIDWVLETVALAAIPRLSTFGMVETDIDPLIASARKSSSMRYNPLPLGHDTQREIILAAL